MNFIRQAISVNRHINEITNRINLVLDFSLNPVVPAIYPAVINGNARVVEFHISPKILDILLIRVTPGKSIHEYEYENMPIMYNTTEKITTFFFLNNDNKTYPKTVA